MTRKTIICCIFSTVTFIGIMLFLWLGCPHYLLYHEQYQLFLLSWNYFSNSIVEPGGLANYISEFIVQFYYVPLYGSILTALILTLIQVFTGAACRHCNLPMTAYILSALPPVIYLGAMGDENILLSFAVAMLLSSLSLFCISFLKQRSIISETLIIILLFTLLYWIAGPIAFSFIVAAGILRRKYISILIGIIAGTGIVWCIQSFGFEQFPMSRLMQGINYYRIPEVYPTILYVAAAVAALIPSITLIKLPSTSRDSGEKHAEKIALPAAIATVIFALIYIPSSFDKEKGRVLEYNALVRQGRWTDIIEKAGNEAPTDNFSLQAVNLALAMTGELNESMFRFPQKGIESLIGKDRLDNTSQLITAEALYRLGLSNIAFSTTFDLQEAIMNDRKSGRLMKRMAECMLINGNYKVAEKYIRFLRNTIFYSEWAKNAEKLLGDDKAVEAHPTYGPLRRNNFRKVAFYDHFQLDKILAMQAFDNGGVNPFAWQYFCGVAMLNGDLNALSSGYTYLFEKFGAQPIPRHVQEAIALGWTFSHASFDGIPFQLSSEVKQQTAALAQAVTQNQKDPRSWSQAAPGSYGVYYLTNAMSGKSSTATKEYQHTHE